MEFNFDDSSNEWRKNKIALKNGCFQYKCKLCSEPIYNYTTANKHFHLFASDFDIVNKEHPNKYIYCEEHLFANGK